MKDVLINRDAIMTMVTQQREYMHVIFEVFVLGRETIEMCHRRRLGPGSRGNALFRNKLCYY